MVLSGEYFTVGEMIGLITMVLSFLIIYKICWKRKMYRKIVSAYFFFLLSTVFAIAGEYTLWDFFGTLEHVSLLISSSVFLYIAYLTHKNLAGD